MSAYTSRWNLSDRLIRAGFLATVAKYKAMGLQCGWDTGLYATVRIYQPGRVSIGARSSLADYTVVWGGGGVEIGSDVLISTHCAIVSLTHAVEAFQAGRPYRETTQAAKITVASNVWIGAGAVIMPGVTLGEGCIIGAGSIVTADVEPGCVVTGSPARLQRRLGPAAAL
jgi:acetyltransferase-like isoleucine patch superfamily enzyme